MRKLFPAITLLFAFLCPSLSFSAVDKKTAADIDRETEKIAAEMVKIRRLIHMDPQLPGREQETAKIVAARLAALGFEVKTGVARGGVVGLLRGAQPGPIVALRADMDAVPIQELADVPFRSVNGGVMHAHGHDIHVAVALGSAYVLNALRDRMKGGVKFIFQPGPDPASEDPESGAAQMIREGVLENPPVAVIFGFHVWPDTLGQVFSSPGSILAASDSFEILVKGRSAQASHPQDGVDAIVLAAQIVNALQSIISRTIEPTDPALLTIGRIEGGTQSDLLADRVRLTGIFRTLNDTTRRKIQRLMEAAVKGTTQAFGGDYSLAFKQSIPAVSNHPELYASMLPVLNSVLSDRPLQRLAPQMMADDFSFYGRKIPSLFFLLGVRNPRLSTAPLESPYFNPDERSIAIGIKIISQIILDCLEQQSRLADSSQIVK
ncbi:MAG TPA: amidohydrolase [Candidatus Aminicenantes bacterium]|nr:amidohydrolase [Acidobacteriota bacterium]HQJ42047.1 amidohydrolase [Candidatus Aminicenantes bacterium]